MSMIAQFVQVTSDALSRARREPEAIEEIFDESPAISAAPLAISQAIQDAWKRRGPQLLAGTLGRLSPELREAMTKRIGVTLEQLQQGGGGDAVIDLMRRRGGIRMADGAPAELTRLRIYPFGWSAADRDLLMQEFRRLRQFYVDASARGLAIVTCIV